jgi:hypothetical protein
MQIGHHAVYVHTLSVQAARGSPRLHPVTTRAGWTTARFATALTWAVTRVTTASMPFSTSAGRPPPFSASPASSSTARLAAAAMAVRRRICRVLHDAAPAQFVKCPAATFAQQL